MLAAVLTAPTHKILQSGAEGGQLTTVTPPAKSSGSQKWRFVGKIRAAGPGPRPRTFRAHHFIGARRLLLGLPGSGCVRRVNKREIMKGQHGTLLGIGPAGHCPDAGFAAAGAFLDQVAGPCLAVLPVTGDAVRRPPRRLAVRQGCPAPVRHMADASCESARQ